MRSEAYDNSKVATHFLPEELQTGIYRAEDVNCDCLTGKHGYHMSPLRGCMSYHMRVNDHIDHAKHCEIVIIMIMNGFVKSADEEAKNPDE